MKRKLKLKYQRALAWLLLKSFGYYRKRMSDGRWGWQRKGSAVLGGVDWAFQRLGNELQKLDPPRPAPKKKDEPVAAD